MLQVVENVYFSEQEIENTPSRKDGVDSVTERKLRIYGCEIIQDAGILLKLPQVTMATAQVLFHRFYFRKSLKKYNVKQVSMASLFLAAKVEEVPKRSRDVINVFNHIDQIKSGKKPDPLPLSKRYTDMKNDLIKTERFMLKEMGFSTYVEHPHKYLLQYLSILNQGTNSNLAQQAWNYMNDSLREPLCVRFRPEVIATACIYMASRVLGIVLPEYPHPWWELFDSKQEQLDEIAWTINQLYKEPPAQYISLNKKKSTRSPKKKHSRSRSSSHSDTDSEHSGSDSSANSNDDEQSGTEHSSRSQSKSPSPHSPSTPTEEKALTKQNSSSGKPLSRKNSEKILKENPPPENLSQTQIQIPEAAQSQTQTVSQPAEAGVRKRQKQYIQRAQPYHHHHKKY